MDNHQIQPQEHNSIEQIISSEINKQMSPVVSYTINKSVGAALAAASGALRQRSYEFTPITAKERLVAPERIIHEEVAPNLGVVITNRLMMIPGCFLLTVMYSEGGQYTAALTTFNEEALNSIQAVAVHPEVQKEIDRQISQLPVPETNVAFYGMYVSADFFEEEDSKEKKAPAQVQKQTTAKLPAPRKPQ